MVSVRRAALALLLCLLGVPPLATIGAEADVGALLERARDAYAREDYLEAARDFARVMERAEQPEVARSAAYSLAILLLHTAPGPQLREIVRAAQLDPLCADIALAARDPDADQQLAAEQAAFVRFRRASERRSALLAAELARSAQLPNLPGSYARGWQVALPGAVDLALDAQGRAWALSVNPSELARIDEDGRIVERIPFALPGDLDWHALRTAHLGIFADGSFLVNTHRYAPSGKALESYPLRAPANLAVTRDDGAVLLYDDGLRVLEKTGELRFAKLGIGIGDGFFRAPRAVATGADEIVVGEVERLQIFDARGAFVRALGQEHATSVRILMRAIDDVAVDAERWIYAADMNGRSIALYDPELRPQGEIPVQARRVVVLGSGLVLGLNDGRLGAAFPIAERVAKEAPLALNGQTRMNEPPPPPARDYELTLTPLASAGGGIRVHTSTRFVNALAADPNHAGVLWLATYGGIVRLDTERGEQQSWNSGDGLGGNYTTRVLPLPDGSVWAIAANQALRRDPEGGPWKLLGVANDRVAARDVVSDPLDPNVVWIADEGGMLRVDPGAVHGRFFPAGGEADEAVFSRDGRLLVRLNNYALVRLDPKLGRWERLVRMEDLRRLVPRKRPGAETYLRTLSYDPVLDRVWIGTLARELFALDPATGKVESALDGALAPECEDGPIRAKRLGKVLFAIGWGCIARLSDALEPQLLYREKFLGTRDIAGRAGADGHYWLGTERGLRDLDLAAASVRSAWDPPGEPPGHSASSLLLVNGRLWAGFNFEGLQVRDLDAGTWTNVAGVPAAMRLRRQGKDVLVAGGFQAGSWRVNAATLEATSVVPQPRWLGLRDLVFDGTRWWGIGGLRPDLDNGLRYRSDGEDGVLGRAEGMPFGKALRIYQDPQHLERLWIDTDEGVVRFDTKSRRASLVAPRAFGVGAVRGRTLWASGGQSVRVDLDSGATTPFPLTGVVGLDPDSSAWLWNIAERKLSRVDAKSGQVLDSIDFPFEAPISDILIVARRGRRTAWVATWDGLIEVPLPPLPKRTRTRG